MPLTATVETAVPARSPLEIAAELARRLGWRLLPVHDVASGQCSCFKGASCDCAAKHPRESEWGPKASNDLAVITEWVQRYPRANAGLATGALSGVIALDVDSGNGGHESLEAREAAHGDLPHTVQALTGSGGYHFFFKYPGFKVTNSAGKLGPGLDIRGDGGMVVLPPSRSAKGPYSWVFSPETTPIAPAPAWLLTQTTAAPHASKARSGDEWASMIASIGDGQRNTTLAALAGALFRSNLPPTLAHSLLHAVNQARCKPALSEREVNVIAASIAKKESARWGIS